MTDYTFTNHHDPDHRLCKRLCRVQQVVAALSYIEASAMKYMWSSMRRCSAVQVRA